MKVENSQLSQEELSVIVKNIQEQEDAYNRLGIHRRIYPDKDFFQVLSKGSEKLRESGFFPMEEIKTRE